MAKTKTQSVGKCELCGSEFSKGSMSRHLQKCVAEHDPPTSSKKTGQQELYHLTVEGTYSPMYWLHLEMAADTKFGELDLFLRDIWLECCGHMSDFRFPEIEKQVGRNLGMWFDVDDIEKEIHRTMNAKLRDRVEPGDVFKHEYDFGSTTELKLKVVGSRKGRIKKHEIRLLARNLPLDLRCECRKPATFICTQCCYESDGLFCDSCLERHECGDEMALPVVNSPRMGVCGYGG